MTRTKVALWLFAITSVLSLIAAFLPVLKGEDIKMGPLANGVIFLGIALATAKTARAANVNREEHPV